MKTIAIYAVKARGVRVCMTPAAGQDTIASQTIFPMILVFVLRRTSTKMLVFRFVTLFIVHMT